MTRQPLSLRYTLAERHLAEHLRDRALTHTEWIDACQAEAPRCTGHLTLADFLGLLARLHRDELVAAGRPPVGDVGRPARYRLVGHFHAPAPLTGARPGR